MSTDHIADAGKKAPRLSDDLQRDHECGDFGRCLAGYPERARALEDEIGRLRAANLDCVDWYQQARAEALRLRVLLTQAAPWLRPDEHSPPECDRLHAKIMAELQASQPAQQESNDGD